MNGIVVGIGDGGARALDWAVREAVARDVVLTAVRAWQVPAFELQYSGLDGDASLSSGRQSVASELVEEQLRGSAGRVVGGEAARTRVDAVCGETAEVLLARAAHADLVVVGSRGHRAVSRALLGSVSGAVVHHAHVPVVVVPEGAQVTAGGRVVVGVDRSPASLAALRFAVALALRHGSALVPVLVRDPVWQADLTVLEASERHALLHEAQVAGAAGLDVQPEVVTGQAAASLVGLATDRDVLVVGNRGHGGFPRLLLGSVSSQCVTHAPCAVAVVRD